MLMVLLAAPKASAEDAVSGEAWAIPPTWATETAGLQEQLATWLKERLAAGQSMKLDAKIFGNDTEAVVVSATNTDMELKAGT
jgi:hypothetical protein